MKKLKGHADTQTLGQVLRRGPVYLYICVCGTRVVRVGVCEPPPVFFCGAVAPRCYTGPQLVLVERAVLKPRMGYGTLYGKKRGHDYIYKQTRFFFSFFFFFFLPDWLGNRSLWEKKKKKKKFWVLYRSGGLRFMLKCV